MVSRAGKKQVIVYICSATLIFLFIVGLAYWHDTHTIKVPILMYHNIEENGDLNSTISAGAFEQQINALYDAGYTAISFSDLQAYVVDGVALPDRPVLITFDDGYMSVYDFAFPILQKYNMKATAFIIGVFYGESTYKGLSYLEITPHFGDAEAREMVASGVFSIQSHSYDMHQFIPYEAGPARIGALRRADESNEAYIEAFNADFSLAADQIEKSVGVRPFVYSYPFGRRTAQTDRLLKDLGVTITVVTSAYTNMLVRNSHGSLLRLGRYNVPGDMTAEELLAMLQR